MKTEQVTLLIFVVCAFVIPCIVGPPVLPEEAQGKPGKKNNAEDDLGLEYERYLKQVIESLEEDEEFRKKLGSAKMEDITSGKIAHELQFVSHHIRTRLDELKRKEMRRLRILARQENELSHGVYPENGKDDLGIDRRRMGMPLHLDVKNEHTFEIDDLRRLVQQTTKDLEEIDRQRREEFKNYEMDKEHRRREELRQMDEERRKKAEKEYEEQQKRHRDHPKLHHPGSKQQLEEVWEKDDQMPTDEFNPKTFFKMHDLDGDDYWTEEEVKSLFRHELDKMYDQNNTDDDMQERREEMDRMREHVVNETDTNNDGLISMAEFLEMTRRNEFNQDPGWQGLDEQEVYRDEEFREYERQYQAGMIPPGGMPVYVPEGMHPGAQYQHVQDPRMGGQQMYPPQGYPQQGQYDQQHMPNYQGSQQQYQQGYHPNQIPQFQGIPPHTQNQHQYVAQGIPPQQQGNAYYQQQPYPAVPPGANQYPNAGQQQQFQNNPNQQGHPQPPIANQQQFQNNPNQPKQQGQPQPPINSQQSQQQQQQQPQIQNNPNQQQQGQPQPAVSQQQEGTQAPVQQQNQQPSSSDKPQVVQH